MSSAVSITRPLPCPELALPQPCHCPGDKGGDSRRGREAGPSRGTGGRACCGQPRASRGRAGTLPAPRAPRPPGSAAGCSGHGHRTGSGHRRATSLSGWRRREAGAARGTWASRAWSAAGPCTSSPAWEGKATWRAARHQSTAPPPPPRPPGARWPAESAPCARAPGAPLSVRVRRRRATCGQARPPTWPHMVGA